MEINYVHGLDLDIRRILNKIVIGRPIDSIEVDEESGKINIMVYEHLDMIKTIENAYKYSPWKEKRNDICRTELINLAENLYLTTVPKCVDESGQLDCLIYDLYWKALDVLLDDFSSGITEYLKEQYGYFK